MKAFIIEAIYTQPSPTFRAEFVCYRLHRYSEPFDDGGGWIGRDREEIADFPSHAAAYAVAVSEGREHLPVVYGEP